MQKYLAAGRIRGYDPHPNCPVLILMLEGNYLDAGRIGGCESHPKTRLTASRIGRCVSHPKSVRVRVVSVDTDRTGFQRELERGRIWVRVASVDAGRTGKQFFRGSDAGRTRHRQRLFWTVFLSLFKGINFCLVLINPNPNSAVQKPVTIIVSSHVLRISGNFDYSFDSCLNWLIFYLDHQLQGVWRFKVNQGLLRCGFGVHLASVRVVEEKIKQ